MSLPPANRFTLAERLASGAPTGALLVPCAGGRHVRVRSTPQGRGLEAASAFARGEEIVHMTGELRELRHDEPWPVGQEIFHVRAATASRPGCWLVLNEASLEELANLTNTAGRASENNAKLCLDRRVPNRVTLRATRPILPGETILAAYGASYTAALNRQKPKPAARGGWRRCECGVAVRSDGALVRHRASFACRRSAR